MTEIELIVDLHKNSDRQGPGSVQDTLRAFGITQLLAEGDLKIADIGCGSGGQTITLAKQIQGQVIAVDLFPEFLGLLNVRAQKAGLANTIVSLEASMDALPFEEDEFDIIWSEGAIYNIGFKNGIKAWNKYLKMGGFLAVSELTWTTQSRPREIEDFWTREYPEIDTASSKIQQLENNGYSLVGYFYLNQDSWIKHYYKPLEARFNTFLEDHDNSELARKVVDDQKFEFDLYKKYKDYYSYGFYVARKS